MAKLVSLKKELRALGTPQKAKSAERFFKTAPGAYGHGDVFLGVTVPEGRKVSARYTDLPIGDLEKLLHSREHEFRLSALHILAAKYTKGDSAEKKKIHDLYLKNTRWINNWDLVDTSASMIVGEYLRDKPKNLLTKLARSQSLWERRIAMIATFAYIKAGESQEAFRVAELLLGDAHDLMHKAVGWMLREVGKRCGQGVEETFLKKHYKKMPRTMLRYAIERFPEKLRKAYMQGSI